MRSFRYTIVPIALLPQARGLGSSERPFVAGGDEPTESPNDYSVSTNLPPGRGQVYGRRAPVVALRLRWRPLATPFVYRGCESTEI